MAFVGGKLKLKGGEPLKAAAGGVKKKKKEQPGTLMPAMAADEADALDEAAAKTRKAIHGYALEPERGADTRTETEKKWEARFKKVEEEKLKKLAGKSHKERVKDFNDYLANLSEHHGAVAGVVLRIRDVCAWTACSADAQMQVHACREWIGPHACMQTIMSQLAAYAREALLTLRPLLQVLHAACHAACPSTWSIWASGGGAMTHTCIFATSPPHACRHPQGRARLTGTVAGEEKRLCSAVPAPCSAVEEECQCRRSSTSRAAVEECSIWVVGVVVRPHAHDNAMFAVTPAHGPAPGQGLACA